MTGREPPGTPELALAPGGDEPGGSHAQQYDDGAEGERLESK